eukprot:gene451-biopygen10635
MTDTSLAATGITGSPHGQFAGICNNHCRQWSSRVLPKVDLKTQFRELGGTAEDASGTRPGRVRFFKFYRVGRVRDASAAVSPYWRRARRGRCGKSVGYRRNALLLLRTVACISTPLPLL